MNYACRSCGHHEVIWNSRDGVTPFGTACPSCGRPDLCHVQFHLDVYAPDHQPHFGQRVWVTLTPERALLLAKRRLDFYKSVGHVTDVTPEKLAQSFFDHGPNPPDLAITGYQESQL